MKTIKEVFEAVKERKVKYSEQVTKLNKLNAERKSINLRIKGHEHKGNVHEEMKAKSELSTIESNMQEVLRHPLYNAELVYDNELELVNVLLNNKKSANEKEYSKLYKEAEILKNKLLEVYKGMDLIKRAVYDSQRMVNSINRVYNNKNELLMYSGQGHYIPELIANCPKMNINYKQELLSSINAEIENIHIKNMNKLGV